MSVAVPHYVYRCYDAEGALLYVGCTSQVARRIAAHRRGTGAKASLWLAATMVRFETAGPHQGREAGRAAERSAIQNEQPLFNYQERANEHQAAWMTRAAVAAYLVAHGHHDLAAETACDCWRESREVARIDPWCRAHASLLPRTG